MPTTFLKQLLQEKESSDFSSLRSAYLAKQQGLRNVFLQQMNKFIAEALVGTFSGNGSSRTGC
ncbi:hypothetical protein [Exiguobacterium sp. R-39]|uniref:hypothetical protein n=1 Tax=Exiguobacterium sp. R-39 TaxID=3416708 RepID=UPI003CF57E4E